MTATDAAPDTEGDAEPQLTPDEQWRINAQRLLAEVRNLTDAERPTFTENLLSELDSVSRRLAPVDGLRRRRNSLLLALKELGVPYRTIAEHDLSGEEACRVAVNKARRALAGNPISRRNRKPRQPRKR